MQVKEFRKELKRARFANYSSLMVREEEQGKWITSVKYMGDSVFLVTDPVIQAKNGFFVLNPVHEITELEKILGKIPGTAEVYMAGLNGTLRPVEFLVKGRSLDGKIRTRDTVFLESGDVHLLRALYEKTDDPETEELDFYMELLENHFGPATIRRFYGEEPAEHMKRFCEEHGLI